MADQQQHGPGGHYSGANPIPTINQFIQRLDKDKSARDKEIDEQNKARKAAQARAGGGDAVPHVEQTLPASASQKTVTDPTTGNQVQIEDVDKSMVDRAKNPTVRHRHIVLSCTSG